jgi:hypothetical protein
VVLQDSSSWSSPPLVLLRDIHNGLLANYDCKDSAPLPPGRNSQDGDSQQQEVGILLIPQLNRLNEAFLVRGEDASNMLTIPSQNKVTQQIISLWQPLKTSSRPWRSGVALNSSVCARSSASLPPLRTLSFGQRWPTSSLRKRMPLDVSYGSSR